MNHQPHRKPFLDEAGRIAQLMREKPGAANDILMGGADRLSQQYGVPYADAKGTIRWLYDGDPVGLTPAFDTSSPPPVG